MIRAAETDDLATCLALRRAVFVDEQGVSPTEEVDGRDGQAVHFLCHAADRPIGAARMLITGGTGKIGRVCVLRDARGTGAGLALMEAAHAAARARGLTRVVLGAQTHALRFYERLGYAAFGDPFDDAGIPHRMMERAP
ncbi:MAG: GNAT family N-acetyltransferase [Shimia sp.]